MTDITLETLKQLAHALSVQFGKNCEVVIYDLTKETLDSSLVYIENGHITNRHTGNGPSQVVLDTYKKSPDKIHDHLGYLTKTRDGKTLKSSTIFIRENPDGAVRYIMGINYDITPLLSCQDALQSLISNDSAEAGQEEKKEPEEIFTNVADLLDNLIAQSVERIGKPAALMTKEERIEAIRFLDSLGAFLITKSGDKVSQYFGISKFTLYNYLKTE